jgi:anaerobic magnesium-protoporphyrin IX monomethyl ester cyclase
MRPYPPLGIMYIASALNRAGFDVTLVDNTFEPDLSAVENAIKKENPDLVGISAVEITKKTALKICSIAKEHGCRVIVGGPDPVNYRMEYFNCGADWICVGEGENTLIELAEKLTGFISKRVERSISPGIVSLQQISTHYRSRHGI